MMNVYLFAYDGTAAFFVVVVCVFLIGWGILSIARPDITWWYRTALRSWQCEEDPEPSDGALTMERVGGVVLILGCLFMLYLLFFSN